MLKYIKKHKAANNDTAYNEGEGFDELEIDDDYL